MAIPVAGFGGPPPVGAPPSVGPEPPGLLDKIKTSVFGQADPNAAAGPPDPYQLTDQQLVDLLEETRRFCEPGRELFEYGWWRNLLYLLNRQWIYWNPTSRQWNDKRTAKWIPKPVTNIVRTTILSVRSTLQTITPGVSCVPNGQDPKNVAAAQTADDLERPLYMEHDMDGVLAEADFWTAILGNCFLHPIWDKDDPTHMAPVAMWQCQLCQAMNDSSAITDAGQKCPECGSQALVQAGEQMQPIGKGRTLVVSPLELMLPLYAQSFEQVDRLIFLTWRPQHDVEDEYGDLKTDDGKPVVSQVSWDTGPQQRALQLYKALATTSDLMVAPTVWNTGAFTGQVKGVTEQHLWIRPNKQFPKGLYMRFLGDGPAVPVRVTPTPELPYKRKDGSVIWPWVNYPYEPIGGRLYAQSAVDAIIQKQDQINQIDSMMQLTAQRMGNPIWLEPKGAEVERFTGEPGVIVRWQSTGANGAKPERVGGVDPPQSFFALREQYKQDAEELAGTYDVLKGQKPAGVEAFSALQLLVERSQSRFTTLFKARAKMYREWYSIVIELERSYGPTQRTISVLGPNNAWTFQTFERANLDGDITFVAEDGSNIPKTALGRRAAIEHANQLQLLNPADTEQRYTILTELGLAALSPSLDTDVKSALQEQDAFEQWIAAGMKGQCPLKVLPWHDPAVHLQQNRKWMNSDNIRQILQSLPSGADQPLPPGAPPGTPQPNGPREDIEQLLAAHLQQHEAMMAPPPGMMPAGGGPPAKPGQPTPAKPGQPGTPPGVGAGRAMANSNQNSGAATPPPPSAHIQGAA